ncbi:hypothetical protein [Streptomyces violaceusniger]|uniref:Uncharacterized protein n=1 Tax=Streptomyces violaceusniger (strain Tu 4113) TaxID=653045 RepID=G2PHT6_STRV4|nr:hypothetical protein [Streptomyces violaceusniger]AEM88887.1 hypothetical protein Strvi_0111 [Streptomyces violaceusniger Tu 4113]
MTTQQEQQCPGWHHWRYEQATGRTYCREDGREVPAAERDAPYRPVRV